MGSSTIREERSDPAAALGVVAAHLQRDPRDDRAWAVAAEALLRLDRPDEAIEAARLAQRPGRSERRALLAWALAAAGRSREAREALAGLDGDPVTWERVARAHDELGDAPAAIEAHARAVALAPADHAGALRLAERLERAGELERASATVARVLAERPGAAAARRVRVRLLAQIGDLDGAAAEARALLQGGELADDVASGLALELARIEARRGHPDEAAAWAERGNRAALGAWRERGGDSDALWRQLDGLGALPRPRVVSDAPAARRAAFVVGFPRSGTTLVQRMLAGHPAVTTFDEAPLVDRALEQVVPGASWAECARAADDPTVAQRIGDAWWAGALRRIGPPPERAGLVVDKLPLNLLRLDVIARAFPDAPVVLVLRDPRDAVLSAWLQDFRLNGAMAQLTDLERAGRLYARALETWDRVRPDRGVTLRYEDVLADPEAAWRPVLEALGLPWDPAVLGPRDGGPMVRTPSYAAVREPLYRRSVGRWQPFAAHLAPALPHLEPWIERLGY